MTAITSVIQCPACGDDHHYLEFRPLVTPIQIGDLFYRQWASCPVNGKRLLLRYSNGTTEVAQA